MKKPKRRGIQSIDTGIRLLEVLERADGPLALKELSAKVTEAKSARIRLESDLAQIKQLGANIGALLGISSVANDPSVREIQSNLSKFDSEFSTIKQRYLPKHPKYIGTLSALNEWRASLTNAVLKIPKTIETAYMGAKASEETLEAALKEAETEALALNKQKIEFDVLNLFCGAGGVQIPRREQEGRERVFLGERWRVGVGR